LHLNFDYQHKILFLSPWKWNSILFSLLEWIWAQDERGDVIFAALISSVLFILFLSTDIYQVKAATTKTRSKECLWRQRKRKWSQPALYFNGRRHTHTHTHTHILVLAVDVSQSAAKPTMSNPVESWLKYLGCAEDWHNRKYKINKFNDLTYLCPINSPLFIYNHLRLM